METNSHLLFVYGSLREGFHNHRMLETAEFVANGITTGKYTMYRLYGYPMIMANGKHKIVGEVYKISDALLARLDRMEIGAGYRRIEERVNRQRVFLYVGDKDYSLPENSLLSSGDWAEHHSE